LELTPEDVKRQIESLEDSSLDKLVGDTGGLDLERSQALPAVGSQPGDSLSLEYGDIPLDETGSTLPSVRAAQRSVQDYFDGTHSMSMSMEEVRENAAEHGDPASADEPRADVETQGDTTSRRRAQAVIDAHVHAPSHSARNIALVLIVLALIGGVGGGAFLYKDRIMAMLDAQPSLVAQQRPGTSPAVSSAARTPAVASAGATESLAAAERDALLRAAESARAEEAARAQATADAEARVRAEVEMRVREIADAAAAQARIEAEAEVQRQAASAASAVMQGVQLAGVLDDATIAPAAFKITRRRGPRRVHKNLVRAFDAFQRGDDGQAMTIYQAVLKREPRNRDAMLGAAAVSLRAGAVEQAAGYYTAVLRRNPRDGAAQAGLIALQDNLDPVSAESRVKELLEHTPGDANLYFSLGNLYAEQGRWPEAQQSYFEAYRRDDVNPDYAFNLAVSLDQLAQSRPALEYYRRAEQLAGEFPAAFDAKVARLRAAELAGL
jgi:tetratricopeptide (TPR) repeat protein